MPRVTHLPRCHWNQSIANAIRRKRWLDVHPVTRLLPPTPRPRPPAPPPDPNRPTPSAWPLGFPEWLSLSPPLLSHLHRPVARPPPRVQIRVHTSSTSCVQCSRVLCSPRGPRPGRTWSPISGPRETQLVGGQARSAAGAPAAMRSEAGERRTRHVARLVGDCPAAPAPTTATGRKEGEARQPSGGSRRQRSTGAGGSPRMRCRDAGLCACGDSGEGERLPRPLGLRTHRERERGERPRRRRSGRGQSPQVGEPGQKGRGRLDRARLGLGLGLGGRAGFRGTLLGSPRARGEGEAGEQWPGLKEGMGWWGSPRGRAASRAGEARSVGRGEEERFP